MSTKVVATIAAAAALPMAVSAGEAPTITQAIYSDSACSTPFSGTEPTTFPAGGSCVDASLELYDQFYDNVVSFRMSAQFTCDGTSVTATQFTGDTTCSSTGVAHTGTIGECTPMTMQSYTVYVKMTDCTAVSSEDYGHDHENEGVDQSLVKQLKKALQIADDATSALQEQGEQIRRVNEQLGHLDSEVKRRKNGLNAFIRRFIERTRSLSAALFTPLSNDNTK